MEDMGSNQGV